MKKLVAPGLDAGHRSDLQVSFVDNPGLAGLVGTLVEIPVTAEAGAGESPS